MVDIYLYSYTDTEVNNCFSIYHTSWITIGLKNNLIFDNIQTNSRKFENLARAAARR